ncbi:MAG: cytochrome c3 family protein [Kofleriaceae bacterium]
MKFILVTLVVLTSAIAVAAPVVKPVGSRMFDHDRHAKAAAGDRDAKRQTAVCADCHQMDAKGERKAGKEHAIRCVKCHKDPLTCNAVKVAGPKSPARRCIICHVPTAGTNCQPSDMPPAPNANSFQAGFAHGKHIAFGAAIERECATCHKPQAPVATNTQAPAHSLCSACHDGQRSKLAMTNCAGCHQAPKGKSGPSNDPFRLLRFDHKKHHAESRQSSCTTCHTKEKMVASQDATVPRPDMASCQNACHNGTPGKPFSAVGTSCTKCHTSGASATFPKNRTDLVFSHTTHATRNVKISNCDACHALKADGNLEAPGNGKNHMPCAASGCHLNEYLARPEKTKICGVCHDESLAFKKAVARMNPNNPKQEWFENMNHASHLAKKGQTNSACGDCHGDKLGGGKPPGDHEACSQCHGKGAPAHDMTECAKCHTQTPPQRAAVSEWSVAATFVHEKHAQDPKTKKGTQCVTCHADVKASKDLASIKKPKMASCDTCHDGKSSFKTTGYECARCHTRPKAAAPTATSMLGGSAPLARN